jgi:hypothetical protein
MNENSRQLLSSLPWLSWRLASLVLSSHGEHTRKCVAASRVMPSSRMRPNPSIEGMPKRLRLLCTPHVKR